MGADLAEILRKNEKDNPRRDLWFPQVMRDARRIGEYHPGLSPESPESMDRLGAASKIRDFSDRLLGRKISHLI